MLPLLGSCQNFLSDVIAEKSTPPGTMPCPLVVYTSDEVDAWLLKALKDNPSEAAKKWIKEFADQQKLIIKKCGN